MKKHLLLLFCVVLISVLAVPASATTYYVSQSSGSNSNNGLSKVTPWKSLPYMQTGSGCTTSGSAPSYSHSSGDIFIMKQGDTWPLACFQMSITDNNLTITFDPTWGTAGGTTGNAGQNVGVYKFDAGGSAIPGNNVFIYAVGQNSVTVDGAEFTGQAWTGSPGFGQVIVFYVDTGTNDILSNAWVHGWSHFGATADALDVMVGNGGSPYSAGSCLKSSVIDGTGASDSGSATFAIPCSDNNIIKNMANGLLTNANAVIHDNQVGPINQSFDSSSHENCIEMIDGVASGQSTVYIYNNVWFSCTAVGLFSQQGGPGGGWEVDYIWNNVGYLGSPSSPPAAMFQYDSTSTGTPSSEVHVWNNTIFAGSSAYCMRAVNRGNGNYSVLDIRNNHCISNSGLLDPSGLTSGATTIISSNLTQTVSAATSVGYTSPNYAPSSGGSPTVGIGANLTSLATGSNAGLANDTTYGGTRSTNARPGSGAWDVGAYEFPSTPPDVTFSPTSVAFPATVVSVTSSGISVTMTNTGSVTLTGITISITGTNAADFGQTNTCSSTLTVSASCTITATFTPSATGSRSASIHVVDSSASSPQSVSLSGSGTSGGGGCSWALANSQFDNTFTTGTGLHALPAFSNALTPGSVIVVAATYHNTGGGGDFVTGVTDTAGNTYVDSGAGSVLPAAGHSVGNVVFYALNSHSTASNVVTIHYFNSTDFFYNGQAAEFTSTAAISFDTFSGIQIQNSVGSPTVDSIFLAPITTSMACEAVVASGGTQGADPITPGVTANTWISAVASEGYNGLAMEYFVRPTAGSITPAFFEVNSEAYDGIALAFIGPVASTPHPTYGGIDPGP